MRMFFPGLTAAEVEDMEYVQWEEYRRLTELEMQRRGWVGG